MYSIKSKIQPTHKTPRLAYIDSSNIEIEDVNTPTTEIVSAAITLIRKSWQLYATDLAVCRRHINHCFTLLKDRHDINQYHLDKLAVVLSSCEQSYNNVCNKPLFIKELSELLKDRKDYAFVNTNTEQIISLEKGQLRFVDNHYDNQDVNTDSISSSIQELNDAIEAKKNYVFVQKDEGIDHSKFESDDYRNQGLSCTEYLLQQGATASHSVNGSDDLDGFVVIEANNNALDGEYISACDGFELYS